MNTTTYKPYLEIVKAMPGVKDNIPVKRFITELDTLSPKYKKGDKRRLSHKVAFKLYQSTREFRQLWREPDDGAERELFLAVSLFHYSDRKESAETLIRAWWSKHEMFPDEAGLYFVVEEAWRLTEQKRKYFYMTRDEKRLMERAPKLKERIVAYLEKKPGSAAEIADELKESRKAVVMALLRLHEEKQISRTATKGVYSLRDALNVSGEAAAPPPIITKPAAKAVAVAASDSPTELDQLFKRFKKTANVDRSDFDRFLNSPDCGLEGIMSAIESHEARMAAK